MIIKMTNNDIYVNALKINEAFNDNTQKLPIKIGFYLQKNKNTLLDAAQNVENARLEIIKEFGVVSENGEYTIPEVNMNSFNKEMSDLANLIQEIEIYKIKLNDFPEDIALTVSQLDALMFMIEE